MTEQLTLIDEPPVVHLKPRQQHIYDAVVAAGNDGLHTDEAGALLHARAGKHGPDDRCRFCGSDGRSILRGELEPKGLVRRRRGTAAMPGAWVVVRAPEPVAEPEPVWDGSGPVPYGVIPY